MPAPVVAPAEAFNEIPEQVPQKQFQNFAPATSGNRVTTKNGRRALLKKVCWTNQFVNYSVKMLRLWVILAIII